MTLKVDKIFETDGNEPFVTFVDQRDRLLGVIPHARAHDLSKYDSPVTMQSVGSCTADAATNALENQLNQFGAEYEADLSRLFLYYCSRRYLQMQDVDKGSSNRMTVRALANIGTCLEPLWPYNADSVLQVPSDAAFDKALDLLTVTLQGDKQLSRPDMMNVLETGGISTANQRGYHILWYLAQNGHLCFGPLQGKQVTFALLDEWAPKTTEIPRDEAQKRLTQSYFTSHGPATMQDLMWWSGMTAIDIKRGLELAKDKLTAEDVDGKTYWMGQDLPDATESSPGAYILPSFDELLLGYKDRSPTLDIEHMPKIVPGMNGMFAATIVIDGKVIGIWRRTIKKSEIIVELAPFESTTMKQKQMLDAAITSYGKYLGLPVTITMR